MNHIMRPRITPEEYDILRIIRSNKDIKNKILEESSKNEFSEIEADVEIEALLNNYLPETDETEYYYDLGGLRNRKGIVISDIHLPYQKNDVINACLKFAKKQRIDFIIINGDLFDNGELSKHLPPKERFPFAYEIKIAKDFLFLLRKLFGDIRIIYKSGNHEEKRLEEKIRREYKAFEGLDCLRLESLLELNNFHIEFVHERQVMKAGNLIILHGHEIAGGGVNIAQSKLSKAQYSILFGHHHKTDYFRMKNLAGDFIEAFSIGCFCKLNPDYMPFNQWNWGFAFIEFDELLKYKINNIVINKYYQIENF